MKNIINYVGVIMLLFVAGCCKDKNPPSPECTSTSVEISPFAEKIVGFWCNNNVEYEYVFRDRYLIDTLQPNCFFTGSTAFPIDNTTSVYILLGKPTHYNNDSFSTKLFIDTCLKKLTYDVNLIQTDTTYYAQLSIAPIYCFAENIPADYQVEVRYKYVPLPE